MAKYQDMASRLRQRVTLETPVLTAEAGGHFNQTWQTVARVWAAIEPLNGAELWFGEQLEGRINHRITLRYRNDLTSAMRIVFGERIFNIRSVHCPSEAREILVISAEEHIAV